MALISDLSVNIPTRLRQAHPIKHDRSFTQCLELGIGAKQITTTRALGFSEIGLLGLHYAQNAPENQIAQVSEEPALNSRIQVRAHQGRQIQSQNPFINSSLPAEASTSFSSAQMNSARVHHHSLLSTEETELAASFNEIMQVDTSVDLADGAPNKLKLQRHAWQNARKCTPAPFKVVETAQGVSVICDGDVSPHKSQEEITEIAQQVAAGFGVTVRQVIVNRVKW